MSVVIGTLCGIVLGFVRGVIMGVVLFCLFVFCSKFWDWMKKFK